LVVVTAALTTFAASQAQATSDVDEAQKAVNRYRVELEELEKVGASEKARTAATKNLTNAQKRLNVVLQDRVLKERNLVNLNQTQIKQEIEKLAVERAKLRVATAVASATSGRRRRALTKQESEAIAKGGLRELQAARASISTGANQLFRSEADEKKFLEFLDTLIETQRAINGLNRRYKDLNKSVKTTTDKVEEEDKARRDATEPLDSFFRGLENLEGALETAAFELESATSDIDSMTSSIETLKDASASATDKIRALGSGLTGAGGLLGKLGFEGAGSTLGFAGAGLGLLGAAGGLLDSIFGGGEQDTNAILDQQLEIQRQQFALQKEQAGIEKKYFEDDLELIRQRARIEGRDPAQELSKAIGAELSRLGFSEGISLESLELQRERVRQESETILQNKQLLQQAEVARGLSQGTIGQRITAIDEIARIRREAGLGRLTGRLGNVVNQTILELTALTQEGQAQRIQQLLEQGVGLIPAGSGAPTPPTPKIATPPAQPTQLVQAQSRGFGIIDISRGGLQTATGFSVTRGAAMAAQAGVPATLGSLAVATEAMKTTEDQMLDTLNSQLSELKRQTEILGQLTGQDVTVAVLNALSSAKTRSI